MPKYRLRDDRTDSEYTCECHEDLMIARQIGNGPIAPGAKFWRQSKLDGTRYTETLVEIFLRPVYNFLPINSNGHTRSDAMGVNPVQIKEAMAADAAIGVHADYDAVTGEALFSSPGERKKYCEAHGFIYRNGGYSDPRSLSARERDNLNYPQLDKPVLGGGLAEMAGL